MAPFMYDTGECIMFAEWETYCIFKEYIRVFSAQQGKYITHKLLTLQQIFNLQTEINHSEKKTQCKHLTDSKVILNDNII